MSKKVKSLENILKGLKQRIPLLIICSATIGLTYFFLTQHYFSYDGLRNDWVYRLESSILDLKFKIRGPQKPSGQVGILAIDEKTLKHFGDYPFSRKYYSRALRNLKSLGVKWVGYDVIFSEQEKAKLRDVKKDLDGFTSYRSRAQIQTKINRLKSWLVNSPADLMFSRAIEDTSNIILGYFFFATSFEAKENLGADKSAYFQGLEPMLTSEIMYDMPVGKKLTDYRYLTRPAAIKSNTPLITNSSEHFAFFSNDADVDAINRWVTLIADINGHLMPSLALKTAANHLEADVAVFFDELGVETISMFSEDSDIAIEIPVDPNGMGRILVNHRGPSKTFPYFSLYDAYYKRFNKEQLKQLNGMSLLVGATATGTNDIRPNVFDSLIDGVENHAAVIDNIIQGDFFKRPISIYDVEMKLVLIVGILFAPLMIWGKSLLSGAAVILFLIGFWIVDWKLWFGNGTWTFIGIPSLEIVGMFIATTLYKYATEEQEKKKVKGAFQHYLSPDVIDQVLDDPDSLALGGERKECTVFFSDVRSFTTISETLSPEKLCDFMNEYFTPMTSIILQSGGTLDKYIGDAIMAFWGAPISTPDHASRAAKASVAMMFALDKLREDLPTKGFPKPDIGIGLNTGPMSVGNMGSDARFSYTVMGDAVNLGSRLEGLTKEYKIKIMISEFTAKQLSRDELLFRDLDDIRVKGKDEPVRVFELMRPDYLPQEAAIRSLIGEFELGRQAYQKQDWVTAEKHFLACLQLKPDDGPTGLYLERIEAYKASSPGENWDGVYTFTHK